MCYAFNCSISTSVTGTTNTCSNNNGGCEHACFPTPEGPSCGCEEGFILKETSSQCSMAMGEFINVTEHVSDTLSHGNDTNTLKTVYVTNGYACRNEHHRNVLKQ